MHRGDHHPNNNNDNPKNQKIEENGKKKPVRPAVTEAVSPLVLRRGKRWAKRTKSEGTAHENHHICTSNVSFVGAPPKRVCASQSAAMESQGLVL